MRSSNLFLMIAFAFAAILFVGCAENDNGSRNRSKITTAQRGGGGGGAAGVGANKLNALSGGTSVPTANNQVSSAAQAQSNVQQKLNGAKRILLENLPTGTYVLSEVFYANTLHGVKPPVTNAANGQVQGATDTSMVIGHSFELIANEQNGISFDKFNFFSNSQNLKSLNAEGRVHNLAARFQVSTGALEVLQAVAYQTSVKNGVPETKASGNPQGSNAISDLNTARANRKEDGTYSLQADRGTKVMTLQLTNDMLVVSEDISSNNNGRQVSTSLLLFYKKIETSAGTQTSAQGSPAAAAAQTAPAPTGTSVTTPAQAAASPVAPAPSTAAAAPAATAAPPASERAADVIPPSAATPADVGDPAVSPL